jgi:hypothetical protein
MKISHTSGQAIDAAGGTKAFADWWGVDIARVSAWRARGFPASLYLSMSERLRNEHQIEAAPSAWNMRNANATQSVPWSEQ